MTALAPVDAAPKFTRGEWTCFYKPKYDEWHVSLPMTGGGMKLALSRDGIQSENREADARLIAAAPDLYAIAVECLELAKLAETLTGCRGDDDYVWGIQERLEAALSKANPVSARGLSNAFESPAGPTSSPAQPGTNHESDGPKSRPGDAAASLTQQSSSPRQERPSAQERSSDRSGGQFGDAPKPAHTPAEVRP